MSSNEIKLVLRKIILCMHLDWVCVRHDRDTLWPVCDPEEWFFKNVTPIRHQIDEMPPYNYTGIDEDINGYFQTTTDTSSSRLMDESYDANSDVRKLYLPFIILI